MNWKDAEGSSHVIIWRTVSTFASSDWGSPRITWVTISGVRAEKWNCSIKLSVCAIKIDGGVIKELLVFLASEEHGVSGTASRPGRSTPGYGVTFIRWIRRLCGPQIQCVYLIPTDKLAMVSLLSSPGPSHDSDWAITDSKLKPEHPTYCSTASMGLVLEVLQILPARLYRPEFQRK